MPVHCCNIAHPPQQPAGNPRGATGAARYFIRPVSRQGHAKPVRLVGQNGLQLGTVIKLQPHLDAEPVTQRCCQQPCARCGPDKGEGGQVDPH